MVPFGLTEAQFATRYRRCLDRAAPRLIKSLRNLFTAPVSEAVAEAEVQIFLGDDGMEAPSAWIYYQGTNNKVDASDPNIFAGKSLELICLAEDVDDFDENYYSDEFRGAHLIGGIVKTWLAECWWKAGGWTYPVPVTVWVHDDFGDGNSIELSEKR